MESENNIHFLELSITIRPTYLNTSIFHKPTSTDTTINFLSNHPLEHKMAEYHYLIHRMHTLPLNKEQQDREWHHIVNTAYSNNITQTLLYRLRHRIQRNYSLPKTPTPTPTPTTNPTPAIKNTKWATFTYTSPQIMKITNLFKHTNVRFA